MAKAPVKSLEATNEREVVPAADQEFWMRAERYMPRPKKGVYVRLDADILDWMKSKGKGYQTRMNAMLRVLMESDQKHFK